MQNTMWPNCLFKLQCKLHLCIKHRNIKILLIIRFISHLGSGNFGTVAKGKWKRQERVIVVAMKTLTEGDEEGKIKFLQEAVIMSQFKHPNVLLLHGICNYKDAVSNT